MYVIISDDIGKVYLSGVPVSPHFVADYVKLCIETETRVVCSDCELEMKGAKELQQHLDETRLLHHCMALTDLDQVIPISFVNNTHHCFGLDPSPLEILCFHFSLGLLKKL